MLTFIKGVFGAIGSENSPFSKNYGEVLLTPVGKADYALARQGTEVYFVSRDFLMGSNAYNTLPPEILGSKHSPDDNIYINLVGHHLCDENKSDRPTACMVTEVGEWNVRTNPRGRLQVADACQLAHLSFLEGDTRRK
ncbi:hypothetical protein ECANGB1_2206 [Enterospora canceri]|uniref:Uncharacterized protein n=1 Tax=Enterospora canceri TaxID=1081671 RepID=A0A1Y1S4X7_9MICR|nr:hypothetical protein ECANGB1_2206 [Enterospora canceri]